MSYGVFYAIMLFGIISFGFFAYWVEDRPDRPDIYIPPTEGPLVGVVPSLHGRDEVNEVIDTLLNEKETVSQQSVAPTTAQQGQDDS